MMRIKLIGFLLAASVEAVAQSYTFGLGPSRILDTYLTPEHFSGTGFTFLYIKERQKPESRWSTQWEHEADISSAKDRSKNISMLEGNYYFYWGKYYNWRLMDNKLRLQAGGMANANIGVLYGMINSNNPVQALPLVGLMFSPNYGQSYYEIFSRGNYDHNIVPTTFISAPTMRQLFTIDWHTGKKWDLRVGYLGNYQQAQVNNLKQHVYTHRVLIGIARSL